jgi:hypothetical protein
MTIIDTFEVAAVTKLFSFGGFCRSELDKLSEDELDRFEYFMRSHFNRRAIKDIVTPLLASHVKKDTTDAEIEQMCIAISSLAKLFVGDVMEAAVEVRQGDDASTSGSVTTSAVGVPKVTPRHITEAVRRMTKEGTYPLARSSDSVGGIPLLNVKSTSVATSSSDFDLFPLEDGDGEEVGQTSSEGWFNGAIESEQGCPQSHGTVKEFDLLDFFLTPLPPGEEEEDSVEEK